MASAEYSPRDPTESVLCQTVAGRLETFLAAREERGRPLPRFVERELRSFLECGVLERGFIRVHCDRCGHDKVVAFSCKKRGFCPSCGGRKMADTAAHLVDRVFPQAPVRQWVLSVPHALRYRLAYDSRMLGRVLDAFIRALFLIVAPPRPQGRDRRRPMRRGHVYSTLRKFAEPPRTFPCDRFG